MSLTAVLMNDTRGHAHFGCQRVMRVIEQNLESRGIKVIARSLVRNDWPADKAFLEAASAADIIVVNGEGTLHHGSRHGDLLLQIADHPVRAGKPIALINAIYQENPEHWRRYLDGIDLISPRDSWSASALREATGREIEHIPDLSLAEGFHPAADTSGRTTLTIGESVVKNTSRALIAVARENKSARFLPIVGTLKSSKPQYPLPARMLREAYVRLHTAFFKLRHRDTMFSKNESAYVDALLHSYLHVSGRFHAVCFALTTKTPFLAFTSNAWKVEALMEDMGIAKWRIVKPAALEELIREPQKLAFSDEEQKHIRAALEHGVAGTAKMFDRVAQLAREGRRPHPIEESK
jgi:hypothetical protein